MAVVTLTPADLAPFATIDEAKAQAMIDDALALAATVAPCILEDTFTQEGAARAILRGAIIRWHESGAGGVTQQTAGPFSQSIDTRQVRRGMFWPSEITQLQELCRDGDPTTQAFAIDTSPVSTDWSTYTTTDSWA